VLGTPSRRGVSPRSIAVSGTTMLVCIVGLAGCGGGHDVEKVKLEEVGYAAPNNRSKLQVRRCLARSGMTISKKGRSSWRFRIVGVLPADELGFVEFPDKSAMYVWWTISLAEAKRVAKVANAHHSLNIGTSRNRAIAHGRGVSTLAVSPMPRDESTTQIAYRCLRGT
jgi:hypothetical protein